MNPATASNFTRNVSQNKFSLSKNQFSTNSLLFLAFPKSPFERELQRLLCESAKNKVIPSNRTNNLDSTQKNLSSSGSNNNNGNGLYFNSKATNAGSLPSSSFGNANNNSMKSKYNEELCVDTNSLKHPVGLEAIKEMTRNKNAENQWYLGEMKTCIQFLKKNFFIVKTWNSEQKFCHYHKTTLMSRQVFQVIAATVVGRMFSVVKMLTKTLSLAQVRISPKQTWRVNRNGVKTNVVTK